MDCDLLLFCVLCFAFRVLFQCFVLSLFCCLCVRASHAVIIRPVLRTVFMINVWDRMFSTWCHSHSICRSINTEEAKQKRNVARALASLVRIVNCLKSNYGLWLSASQLWLALSWVVISSLLPIHFDKLHKMLSHSHQKWIILKESGWQMC